MIGAFLRRRATGGWRVAGDRLSIEVDVRSDRLVRIENPASVAVTCLEGSLWVTQLGDRRDHLLDAGHAMSLRPRGTALLDATSGVARCRIVAAPDARCLIRREDGCHVLDFAA